MDHSEANSSLFKVKLLGILIVCTTLIQLVLTLSPQIPLGISGEWTWVRYSNPQVDLFSLAPYLIVVVLYAIIILKSASFMVNGHWISQLGLVILISGIAFALMLTSRAIPQSVQGLSGTPLIIYYPRTSGYYQEAMKHRDSIHGYLESYEEKMKEGDYLHIGTHPPGLTLSYMGIYHLCQRFPVLISLSQSLESSPVIAALDMLQELPELNQIALGPTERATIHWAILLTTGLCAATCLPLFLLMKRTNDSLSAWLCCAILPLIPGISLFAPKSDLLLAFWATATCACWVYSWLERKPVLALISGILLWCGLMTSLALLTILPMLGIWTVAEQWKSRQQEGTVRDIIKSCFRLQTITMFLTGLVVPVLVFYWSAKVNLLNVWMLNLQNHARFYEFNERSYGPWILMNLFELAGTLGFPIMTLIAFWGITNTRSLLQKGGSALFSVAGVWLLLWLSGKNMGEAARLWIFLTPLFLWVMTAFWKDFIHSSQSFRMIWVLLLICQALITTVMICTIDGFHFDEVLRS